MCPRWICGWLCGGGSTVDEQTIATPARVPSQIKAAGGGKEGGDSEAKRDKGGAFEAGGGKEGGNSEVGTEAAGGTPDSDAAVTTHLTSFIVRAKSTEIASKYGMNMAVRPL
ncbi:hypothetical protein DFH08DRAFT_825978 [Mycena albidolilacea]|uniref:Uncharacterized protein n=1 Tax=Mycena albidolilacea TaxID=1033008 RepID=A0AAD7E9E2_9AGAR|nr:hypothetical protein DFH08DRAFT_825978 [Mycena albidolilacea]